ncbi:YebC/PmpR family DNA-binding transcriptional regulator [Hydrogenimonas urashimensis]|uniref:YebC/PmpR family DNA-binding transcriptional regulator n=1 Tax=Hydrogenimonas urashimensis TaxID=2740515 RepID=UPI0019164BFE|nr:YebC/PmpR family DNA-binding transcriptional regulator [Hydrogenimonas urashimensis]
MGRAFEYRKAAKLKRWGAMSRIFPKLGRIITIAAREGGPDPDMNPKLRTAILNAKAQNMPKDNIEAAIKRAQGKDAADIKEIAYEAKGPYGTLMVIECATDNPTRTVANVRAVLVRNSGELLTSGSLDFMFNRKAVFEFDRRETIDLEELELELIDYGLEELEEDKIPQENGEDKAIVRVFGEYTSFGELAKALEERGIEVTKASLQRVPNVPLALSDEQMDEVATLIEKLEDDEDVQAVYTNLA